MSNYAIFSHPVQRELSAGHHTEQALGERLHVRADELRSGAEDHLLLQLLDRRLQMTYLVYERILQPR